MEKPDQLVLKEILDLRVQLDQLGQSFKMLMVVQLPLSMVEVRQLTVEM
jgi:hypothetical protein